MLKRFRYRFLNFWTIATVVLLAFFALSLLYPLGSLFLNSFKDSDGGLTLQNYVTFSRKNIIIRLWDIRLPLV